MVLLLDTSASMGTQDVAPSRFFLARQALLQLISRLEGDRFALVAFEGEAYPLVPLTLDADALGLFLETVEPGIVPAPGTSLGVGLAKGLDAFVDKERRNKVMVLVSDGEDLEGEVEAAVRRAKEAGVVVHTVGVGTEAGQPVPDDGLERARRRLQARRGRQPGGLAAQRPDARGDRPRDGRPGVPLTPQDTSLSRLADAIEGWSRRRSRASTRTGARSSSRCRSRWGWPRWRSACCCRCPFRGAPRTALAARPAPPWPLALGAGGAPPRRAAAAQAAPARCARGAPCRRAPTARLVARRDAAAAEARHVRGAGQYERGQPPAGAVGVRARGRRRARWTRPCASTSPTGCTRTAATTKRRRSTRRWAPTSASRLAAPARYNLGNTLFQKQDYKGAVQAYRDALRLAPGDGRHPAEPGAGAACPARAGGAAEAPARSRTATAEAQDQKKDKNQQQDQKQQPAGQEQDQQRQQNQPKHRAGPEAAAVGPGEGGPALPAGGRHAEASGRCSCSTRCSRTRRPSRGSCWRRSAPSGRRGRTGERPGGASGARAPARGPRSRAAAFTVRSEVDARRVGVQDQLQLTITLEGAARRRTSRCRGSRTSTSSAGRSSRRRCRSSTAACRSRAR